MMSLGGGEFFLGGDVVVEGSLLVLGGISVVVVITAVAVSFRDGEAMDGDESVMLQFFIVIVYYVLFPVCRYTPVSC